MDESKFILGIDVGDATSSIAYFDARRNAPEVLDVSGGYGRASAPTALQYVAETAEWVFGEYALLNDGGAPAARLLTRLIRGEELDVGGRPYGAAEALGVYLKELIGNCRNLNPKAEVARIALAVPDDAGDDLRAGLTRALAASGFGDCPVEMATARACAMERYLYERAARDGRVVLLDFAARALRASVFTMTAADGGTKLACVAAAQEEAMGANAVNRAAAQLFERFYREGMGLTEAEALTEQAERQLAAFTYQHTDVLFQKADGRKPPKLYYNFAYPPFERAVPPMAIDELIRPFADGARAFLRDLLAQAGVDAQDEGLTALCVGGGFEMRWARGLAAGLFPRGEVVFYKNAKAAMAEGACIRAAAAEGLIAPRPMEMTDLNIVRADIGVGVAGKGGGRFLPLVRRGTNWRLKNEPVDVIVKDALTDGAATLALLTRGGDGAAVNLCDLPLSGLPSRPAGATRLRLSAAFETHDRLSVTARDMGFGELYRVSGYEQTFTVEVK